MSLFGGRGTRARLRSSIASGSAVGWRFAFSARVREIATHVRAPPSVCVRACVRVHSRTIRNRVARCTDSTSSIGSPNAEEKEEEEEEEDRIDSPVTRTRDRATTSLTSVSSKNPVGLHEMLRAKNKASTIAPTGYCEKMQTSKRSSISSQKGSLDFSHFSINYVCLDKSCFKIIFFLRKTRVFEHATVYIIYIYIAKKLVFKVMLNQRPNSDVNSVLSIKRTYIYTIYATRIHHYILIHQHFTRSHT